MNVAVVLVAAGNGERLGLGVPKALVKIGSKTILEHALAHVEQFAPDQLVVVAHEDHLAEFEDLVANSYSSNFQVAIGGATRQGSVANGLAKITADLVLVHDAARCFTPVQVFTNVLNGLERSDVVVPVIAIADTVKRVVENQIVATEDRAALRLSQTPQGFKTEQLRAALDQASGEFTDEAALMQSQGHSVLAVYGDALSHKVTSKHDLAQASANAQGFVTGIGSDAHRFSTAGQLMLGCLSWPDYPALEGHSDGDSIAHAIVDALLSAAALGDIGSNFGVDRPEFQGAAGEVFILEALRLVSNAGFEVENVAVQVIADKPKIGPRRAALEERLSEVVGVRVSVGATTTDGLGFLADAKGVAAVSTALLRVRG